jgi:hypothetical protein
MTSKVIQNLEDDRTESMTFSDEMSLGDTTDNKKGVEFTSVTIREYPICVGDACPMTGVPITIDWGHVSEIDCTMDEFEASKTEPRSYVELRIPSQARLDMLKRLGFTLRDIQRGQKSANTSKAQRKRTQETMGMSSMQEKMEKMKKATFNATIGIGKKKKERNLLKVFSDSDGVAMRGSSIKTV